MKLGCMGCMVLVIVLVIAIVLGVAGTLFLSANIYGSPEVVLVPFTSSDGFAAQQKLFEVLRRESGRSSRQDPIVLTDREATAFLSKYLEQTAGLPLAPITVRFIRREILIQGRTPLRHLLQGPPFAQLVPYLPEQRVNQPVNTWLLTFMMGPSSMYLLRWQVPSNVERVEIEDGQLVIRTR